MSLTDRKYTFCKRAVTEASDERQEFWEEFSLSTDAGSGSRAHDLHGKPVMMVLTSSMKTGLRVSRVCVDGLLLFCR